MIKLLFLVFSLFKYVKFSKLLLTGGTMLLSIATYAMLFGWRYAAGFVGLIFCHEMGHYLTARQRGLDVGAPTFIPFVGAWIQLKEQPLDAETEAYVAIAGPMLGTAAALAVYLASGGEPGLLSALAYSGFMLNLFNLIPVSPLDGGRVLGVVSPRIWGVGLVALAASFFIVPNPLVLIIALVAIPKVVAAWKGTLPEPAGYYDLDAGTRARYLLEYLLLAGFLAYMTASLHTSGPRG